jgi:hypothetical protein
VYITSPCSLQGKEVTGGKVSKSVLEIFCQKNEGFVEIKQRPIKMGGRTNFTGHCHLKGHLFKLGLTDDHLRKVPRRTRISHTYPV